MFVESHENKHTSIEGTSFIMQALSFLARKRFVEALLVFFCVAATATADNQSHVKEMLLNQLQSRGTTTSLALAQGVGLRAIGQYQSLHEMQRLELNENNAFVTFSRTGDDGYHRIDISNPSNPFLAFSDTITGYGIQGNGTASSGLDIDNGYIFLSDDVGPSIRIINKTDNVNVGNLLSDVGHGQDVAVIGNYAYLAHETSGLYVIDVSNKANPVIVNTIGIGTSMDSRHIAFSGNHLFLGCNRGWIVFDITNPAIPQERKRFEATTAYGITAMTIEGTNLFLALGDDGIERWDISVPQAPTKLDKLSSRLEYVYSLIAKGRKLFAGTSGDHIFVYDFEAYNSTDVLNDDPVGAYAYSTTTGAVTALSIKSGKLYALHNRTLDVFDILEGPSISSHVPNAVSSSESLYACATVLKGSAEIHAAGIAMINTQNLNDTLSRLLLKSGTEYCNTIPAGRLNPGRWLYGIAAVDSNSVLSFEYGYLQVDSGIPAQVELFFNPDTILVKSGGALTTTAALWIKGVSNMQGLTANIDFDPSRLVVKSIRTGELLSSSGGSVNDNSVVNNVNGTVTVQQAILGNAVQGSGAVIYLTVASKGSADPTSLFALNNVSVRNTSNEVIPSIARDGHIVRANNNLLGDFDEDEDVDFTDFTQFVIWWNEVPDNPKGDIVGPVSGIHAGCPPWTTNGYPYKPDGVINFEDQIVMAIQYNWSQGFTTCTDGAPQVVKSSPTNLDNRLPYAAQIGDTFSIEIDLGVTVSIAGWQHQLSFDTTALRFISADCNKAKELENQQNVWDESDGNGSLQISRTLHGRSAESPEPLRYVLTFKALTEGTHDIEINNLEMRSSDNVAAVQCNRLTRTIRVSSAINPESFQLEQNYPNPFNPTTSIVFSLPQAGEYKFTVYNLLGQDVVSQSGFADAGKTEVTINGSQLASGIYFYRLTAGTFESTRKMLLLK
jgi:hypothetical protein